jgi:spermidine/putrescine transport system substrate-binding protein
MKKIKKLIAILFGLSIICGCGEDKPKIYIYTWADYINPDLIQQFENENNCKVVIDTFDSNETMFAKLMAGANGYDIIMPTEYIIPQLVNADLLEKLDLNKLPNVTNNFDNLFKNEFSLKYTVPYAFGCTGILWRKDKCPPDLTFQDWNEMFDSRLKGRISIMNDVRELLGITLKMNGYSANSINPKELDAAVITARKWKNACSKMDNEAYRTGIPAAEFYVAMAYSSDAIQLMCDGCDDYLGYSIPTNGTTASVDTFCIMKKSLSKDLAYKFVDMFYSLSNAVQNAEYNGVPMPVVGLYDALSDKYKRISLMKITNDIKMKCENIKDISSNLDLYSKAWDSVKAK